MCKGERRVNIGCAEYRNEETEVELKYVVRK